MHPRRINIAEDNSCMFNAVHYLMNNETPQELRQIVASIILSKPHIYTKVYLGKDVDSYIEDIMSPDQWGGAIDLQIIAEYYKTEIAAFNIENGKPVVYGEGRDFPNRIYLIYNGIHYDSLVIEFGKDFEALRIFSSQEMEYFELFRDLTALYTEKGDYINLNKFSTQCQTCLKKLLNSKDIQEHATKTGHTDFKEVRN